MERFSLAFWVAAGFAVVAIIATVLALRRSDLAPDSEGATAPAPM